MKTSKGFCSFKKTSSACDFVCHHLFRAEQNKRGRGGGSIYKQKYRTADGELRESPFWSIKYYKHGVPFRESSHSQKWVVAERLLRKRLGEIDAGVFVAPEAERLL